MMDAVVNYLEDPPALLNVEDSDCSSDSNDNQSTQSQDRFCQPCQENDARNYNNLKRSGPNQYTVSSCIEKSCKISNQFETKQESRTSTGLFGFLGFDKDFYCMCQVKKHCTKDSAWLLVGNKIYDVTTYIKLHPGGERSILNKCGGANDCTIDMKFHSHKAQKLWKEFYIGNLKPCQFSKR